MRFKWIIFFKATMLLNAFAQNGGDGGFMKMAFSSKKLTGSISVPSLSLADLFPGKSLPGAILYLDEQVIELNKNTRIKSIKSLGGNDYQFQLKEKKLDIRLNVKNTDRPGLLEWSFQVINLDKAPKRLTTRLLIPISVKSNTVPFRFPGYGLLNKEKRVRGGGNKWYGLFTPERPEAALTCEWGVSIAADGEIQAPVSVGFLSPEKVKQKTLSLGDEFRNGTYFFFIDFQNTELSPGVVKVYPFYFGLYQHRLYSGLGYNVLIGGDRSLSSSKEALVFIDFYRKEDLNSPLTMKLKLPMYVQMGFPVLDHPGKGEMVQARFDQPNQGGVQARAYKLKPHSLAASQDIEIKVFVEDLQMKRSISFSHAMAVQGQGAFTPKLYEIEMEKSKGILEKLEETLVMSQVAMGQLRRWEKADKYEMKDLKAFEEVRESRLREYKKVRSLWMEFISGIKEITDERNKIKKESNRVLNEMRELFLYQKKVEPRPGDVQNLLASPRLGEL